MSDNKSSARGKKRPIIGTTFIGCLVLGICILVAGLNIGGSIKKLNKTINETQFASTNTYNSPSEISLGQKKYLTLNEAAVYLNLTSAKIEELISNGKITEYVRTDNGYTISIKVLDEWFDNEAYQTKNGYNNAETTTAS